MDLGEHKRSYVAIFRRGCFVRATLQEINEMYYVQLLGLVDFNSCPV